MTTVDVKGLTDNDKVGVLSSDVTQRHVIQRVYRKQMRTLQIILSSRMRVVTSLKRAWRKPDELAVRQAIVVAWRRAVSVALSAKQTRYRQELWVTSSGISVRGGIKVTIFIPSTLSYSLSSWFTSSCMHHLITVSMFALTSCHSLEWRYLSYASSDPLSLVLESTVVVVGWWIEWRCFRLG